MQMIRTMQEFKSSIVDGDLRLFLALWHDLRSGQAAPKRSQLKPEDINHLMPHVFLLELPAKGEAICADNIRFRLVGEAFKILIGRDPTGLSLRQALPERAALAIAERLALLRHGPTVLHGIIKSTLPSVASLLTERLVLPYTDDSGLVTTLLGVSIRLESAGDYETHARALMDHAEIISERRLMLQAEAD